MHVLSLAIKVKTAAKNHSLKHAHVATDRFGDRYEVTAWGQRGIYRCVTRCDLRDESAALQFIDRMPLEPHEWRHLLHALRVNFERGIYAGNELKPVLARLLSARSIEFARLPRLDRRLGLPGERHLRYCFIPGPTPLPLRIDAEHIPIFTQVQAQAVINTVDFTNAAWLQLFRHAGQGELAGGKSSEECKARLHSLLAEEEVLAYTLKPLSEARSQSPLSMVAAAAAPAAKGGGKAGSSPVRQPPSSNANDDPPAAPGKTDFSDRKGVQPTSLSDALQRLQRVKGEIAKNGVHRKYSSDAIQALAAEGTVARERYHVRLMESPYLTRGEGPGMLGAPMQTVSGMGAKYWSTTFDQAEDADCIAELHCRNVGIPYKPEASYVLAIVDMWNAKSVTGVESIVPTFDALSRFANTELPDEFSKGLTDATMTPAFQKLYAQHHAQATNAGFLENPWDRDADGFSKYLAQTNLTKTERDNLEDRFRMHHKLGNNAEFEGNGLTKQLKSGLESKYPEVDSSRAYGVVETFNFERKMINLDQLVLSGAVSTFRLG